VNAFIKLAIISLLAFGHTALAAAVYQEGKDYTVLSSPELNTASTKAQPEIIEFFSYNCPACYALEPDLQQWVEKKGDKIRFFRSPVVYQPEWQNAAKAYYIAAAFGLEDKITPQLFKAAHEKGEDLNNYSTLEALFAANGIDKAQFKKAMSSSLSMDLKLKQGEEWMHNYKAYVIPAFVVAHKYKTDLGMVKGDREKLFKLLDFLVSQSKGEKQ